MIFRTKAQIRQTSKIFEVGDILSLLEISQLRPCRRLTLVLQLVLELTPPFMHAIKAFHFVATTEGVNADLFINKSQPVTPFYVQTRNNYLIGG